MKSYQLKQIQHVPISLDEAWNFFSSPKNLKTITPDYMGFDIISCDDKPIYPGQIITYQVTPLLGIPMDWMTEITHVIEKKYFVDEQRFGPYALWHHKHFFREIENGIELEDIVDFVLPLGILGQLAYPILVKGKLNEIFEFRRKKLAELFGTME
ncbi:MAG: SRPBCC family protein [Chitinophagales bacterium]|nr:SRPBCC family protein [Chitinophagales bacterium]